MPVFPRSTMLRGLGAAALASGASAPALAEPIPLKVGIIPISTNVPFYAADKLGYFAAENLAVTSEVIRGGAAAIPAMLNGAMDVVFSNSTSVAQAVASGIDLRIILSGTICATKPPDPGAMLKRRGEPIRTGKDLEGKVVAVNTLRDIIWMVVTAWITSTGGDLSKVQIIEMGLPAMVDAIKQKRVDSALIIDPFLASALQDPTLELLSWPMSSIFPGGPMAFFAITGSMAQKRPNDIRAFIRAYERGAAWATANFDKQPYYDLIAGFSGLNVDVLKRMAPAAVQAPVIPSSLQKLTAMMRRTGLLTSDLDLTKKVFV